MTGVAANPHEGEVAVPFAAAPGGAVVGRFGARAWAWFEQESGKTVDELIVETGKLVDRAAELGKPTLPMVYLRTILWASIEHARRMTRAEGPPFTMDDADTIVEDVGVDTATGLVLALVGLSAPLRRRKDEMEAAARATREESAVDPHRPVGGTGTATWTPPSTPASPSATHGSSPPAP